MVTTTSALSATIADTIRVQQVAGLVASGKWHGSRRFLDCDHSSTSRCYVATWRGEAIAYCTVEPAGSHDRLRIARIIVLPDFRGMGIGTRLAERVAELEQDQGRNVKLSTSHPALLRHLQSSPLWRAVTPANAGRNAQGRRVVTFEFAGN